MSANDDILATYEQLLKVRESKTLSIKPTPMLKSEIIGFDGNLQTFKLRYYQVQAIYHLLSMKRMVLGDAAGSGKTICAIATFCYIWEKIPDSKVVIVTPKSAIRQWGAEFLRFADGLTIYLVEGAASERRAIYEAFAQHPKDAPTKAVLILGYASLIRDWNTLGNLLNLPNLIVAFDEAQAFKNTSTKTWQVCRELSAKAIRCYGLTATLLKNNLIEGFSIYKCIHPGLFTTKTKFLEDYCVTRLQPVAGGRRIPIIVGYRNLNAFRRRIDPFFLGRPKHLISDELPHLITKEILVELSDAENAKYKEALSGVLALGDGEIRNYEEHKRLVALIYCQQTVNSLALLKYEEGDIIDQEIVEKTSTKEQALLDLLTGEFDDEKVIVYTRFASLIPRLQKLCTKIDIENTAVTGKVVDTKNNPARQRAMEVFQDLNSKVRVIFISDAGSEAINLQAASAMIFLDAPWSWGNYVQLLGRPIRIGSPHQHVVAVHIIAERPQNSGKTIDHYTLEILQRKKNLIDKVLGESAVGALDFDSGNSFALELLSLLQKSEKSKKTEL